MSHRIPPFQPSHYEEFRSCFPSPPPEQATVGRSPRVYLDELTAGADADGRARHSRSRTIIEKHLGGELRRLTGNEVRGICRDSDVAPLDACAVAMAWGGQHLAHFRSSVSGASRDRVVDLIDSLRSSPHDRATAFGTCQKAAEEIPGLGISFYTKLPFFFREDADAYILDQWTAKSAHLLFDRSPINLTSFGLPHPRTTPDDYEKFCGHLEILASELGWDSGEVAERAVFDTPKGAWRSYVRNQFEDSREVEPPEPDTGWAGGGGNDSEPPSGGAAAGAGGAGSGGDEEDPRYAFGKLIIKAHIDASRNERLLPGGGRALHLGNLVPYRIVCSSVGGVSWQYNVAKSRVRIDIFFPRGEVARYERLREDLGLEGHDFGDGVDGNGADNGETRSIYTKVEPGANAPRDQWQQIADDAVGEMQMLFERFGPYL